MSLKRSYIVFIVVTSSELESVAESIRPHTKQAMKMEVAPWIRDYVVDTEELYTEVELEEIRSTSTGEETVVIKDYRELFANYNAVENVNVNNRSDIEPQVQVREGHRSPLLSEDSSFRKKMCIFCCSFYTESEPRLELSEGMGHRVLMKGDPGIGKTILCKKITWDWATKSFTKFSLVFIVLLKFVKSDESIESIILQQNSGLKDMKVTLSKLQSILETFGSSCLVIFDGLDEHDFGTNTDVVSIMKGEKYLNCNILVTSRPHAVGKIAKNFPLVVRVGGFTRAKARHFVSKVIPSKQKIESIMNFNPVNLKGDYLIYECPTLLSFLCLLVKEDDIDLKDRTIHTGDIYMRMIKRFLKRKEIQFELDSFIKVLVSIGKLALEALLSGNSLLKKSEVLQGIGSEAFECGLLIGHEDADSPNRDDSVDIFVTFTDRSLQQFLAAFYFIWMLNQKHSITSLLGDAGG